MNEDNITGFKLDPDCLPTLAPEQRARLDAMTEEDTRTAALADSDNPPLTEEELARFERIPDVQALHERLQLSQKQFAEVFRLSLAVVREWEQSRFIPNQAARTLLKVLDRNPEVAKQALAKRA